VVRDDAELLDAWRGGDKAAGEQLFERHFDAVARFFHNKVRDSMEDLIQKTFLACVETRDRFRGDASFRTYVFAVAHNVLCKHLRSKRREHERIDFDSVSVHDLDPGPSTVFAKRREQQLLVNALRRIPLDCQVVLELYFWERLSAGELARVLDVPEGTVRTRIRRAKQLLEQAMHAVASSPAEATTTIQDLEAWAASLREYSDGNVSPPRVR